MKNDHIDLYKSVELADAEVVITIPRNGAEAEPAPQRRRLARGRMDAPQEIRFPAHRVILRNCIYFRGHAHFTANAQANCVLTYTVNSVEHMPAVEAIFRSMYGAEGDLLKLQQHQLVHVVQYASELGVESVLDEAASLLVNAASTPAGLTEASLQCLATFTWPDALLRLLPAIVDNYVLTVYSQGGNNNSTAEDVFIKVFGELETVWRDKQLQQKLLGLPLPVIKLLLSSDKLQLFSEDTCLYTAESYIARLPADQQAHATQQLSELIRVPYLSDFQLIAQSINQDTTPGRNLLQQYRKPMQQLMTLRRFDTLNPADIKKEFANAPSSWHLPARCVVALPAQGVMLEWQLPVDEIKAAYHSCTEGKRVVFLYSDVSPPLAGMDWQLISEIRWDTAADGVIIGVFSRTHHYPQDVYFKYNFTLGFCGRGLEYSCSATCGREFCWGMRDFFKIGPIRGEWDTSAWVLKGLPTVGNIELQLYVTKVF